MKSRHSWSCWCCSDCLWLAPRIKRYCEMFPSEEERKKYNLKNGNSPNDFLAFMGGEGSIQIKPKVRAYCHNMAWYLLLRGQKQEKHCIQITKKKDLGVSLMKKKKKRKGRGGKGKKKKRNWVKIFERLITMDDTAGWLTGIWIPRQLWYVQSGCSKEWEYFNCFYCYYELPLREFLKNSYFTKGSNWANVTGMPSIKWKVLRPEIFSTLRKIIEPLQ